MHPDHRTGLHAACRRLSPVRTDYAELPIEEGFDWSPCLADAPFDELCLVVFRSVRRATADLRLLKEYDDHAYAEAREAGGLLKYFKGDMNERRECLSFCLWESREHASRAAGGASHAREASISAEMYESYDLERYRMKKGRAAGYRALTFEPMVVPAAAG